MGITTHSRTNFQRFMHSNFDFQVWAAKMYLDMYRCTAVIIILQLIALTLAIVSLHTQTWIVGSHGSTELSVGLSSFTYKTSGGIRQGSNSGRNLEAGLMTMALGVIAIIFGLSGSAIGIIRGLQTRIRPRVLLLVSGLGLFVSSMFFLLAALLYHFLCDKLTSPRYVESHARFGSGRLLLIICTLLHLFSSTCNLVLAYGSPPQVEFDPEVSDRDLVAESYHHSVAD